MFGSANTKKVLNDFEIVGRIGYIVSRYDFTIRFATLIPKKEVWSDDMTDIVGDFIQMFTDCCKIIRSPWKSVDL